MFKKKKIKKIGKAKKTKRKQKRNINKKIVTPNTFKTSDEKVQIKKIKKQATEKRLYNVNDHIANAEPTG